MPLKRDISTLGLLFTSKLHDRLGLVVWGRFIPHNWQVLPPSLHGQLVGC